MGKGNSSSWPVGPQLIDFAWPALLAFAFTCFAPALLGDGDTWWHVKAGEWMLEHRAVPTTDPFSYTFAGQPWHAHEWLAELFMALAYRAGGWAGVVLICATAVGGTVGLLHQWVRRFVSPLTAGVATFLATGCLTPGLLARPHLLVWPLLVIWLRVLLRAREAGRAPSPWWLLLIVVWANMHGTALFAAGLVGVFALEALLERPREWQVVVGDWAPLGVGAAAALLATPRGLEGLLFLIELTRMQSLASIVEWLPPDFSHLTGIELLLFAGLAVMLSRGVKVPPVRLGLVLLVLHMTLVHQRHQMLFGIIATMLCCEAIGRAAGPESERREEHRSLVALAALAVLAIAGLRMILPVRFPESDSIPEKALAAVPQSYRSQPVLNLYGSGGYLIGNGVRPFIDGRTDLYGDAFVARYEAIIHGQPGELDKALGQYAITWTFLPPDSTPARELDRRPGWRRVYADQWIAVHLKDR